MTSPVTRPHTLAFVMGTGTEVGKTWWTAKVASLLRINGVAVAARKPVQSGDGASVPDNVVLAEATGEDPDWVCPPHRRYGLAWAPPMAAAELGLSPYSIDDLARETEWLEGTNLGLVEGVGGPRSPIATDGDNVDLARVLAPDLVVLVADAGLGTINAVRLSMDALTGFSVVVALNRYEAAGLAPRNREVLASDGYDIVTSPEELATRMST